MLQIEGTFPTGTSLLTVHNPICSETGDISLALYGSFIPIPPVKFIDEHFPLDVGESLNTRSSIINQQGKSISAQAAPGAVRCVSGTGSNITLNVKRPRVLLRVINTGDRPVQVGSHIAFSEVNPLLSFDRLRAHGYRLDIASGTSVRFEPGECKTVKLVRVGGNRFIQGSNGFGTGFIHDLSSYQTLLQASHKAAFLHVIETDQWILSQKNLPPTTMQREQYTALFGPTVGDMVRLGLTDLWVRVEYDMTHYGDECSFGGGKSLRDGMGQASNRTDDEVLDTVITNALILDWTGIYKADIGIKDGYITGIGKAGNPDIMSGVTCDMVIGACTDVIAAENRIVMAGGIDSHVHFICHELVEEALASGITTLIGGGMGASTGSKATTCSPGVNGVASMLKGFDGLPVNIGITGKGSDSSGMSLYEQVKAGAIGLKIHEDWGATPQVINECLKVCDAYDIQCLIHTDTLNECGFVEQTLKAIAGRTIHTYHSEGAGGGHAPDILKVVQYPNILPSSTNPTHPFNVNTLEEHLDMIMVCHHLNRNIPEDVAFAESRIRGETMAAEDVLHDIGAISMISSDSQAMGRIGEIITRSIHAAHKNKLQRGTLDEDICMGVRAASREDAFRNICSNKLTHVDHGNDCIPISNVQISATPQAGDGDNSSATFSDNIRVRRYISKFTINPALVHGMGHIIGSIEVGKLADLTIWKFDQFAVKPEIVVKSGRIVYAYMGNANASLPTIQPCFARPAFTKAYSMCKFNAESAQYACETIGRLFISQEAWKNLQKCHTSGASLPYTSTIHPVMNCRSIDKSKLPWNTFLPRHLNVDPESYQVSYEPDLKWQNLPRESPSGSKRPHSPCAQLSSESSKSLLSVNPPVDSLPLTQDYFVF